jgi:hypothetical protein
MVPSESTQFFCILEEMYLGQRNPVCNRHGGRWFLLLHVGRSALSGLLSVEYVPSGWGLIDKSETMTRDSTRVRTKKSRQLHSLYFFIEIYEQLRMKKRHGSLEINVEMLNSKGSIVG